MRHQPVIFGGILMWLSGCILDSLIFQFSYLLIITGTIISFAGAVDWCRSSDNRKKLKEVLSPKSDLVELIKQAFDFSWKRISILWTFIALFGMLIVHLGSIMMKNTRAYECAVQKIKKDKNILDQIGEVKDFSYMITGHTTSGNGFSELNIGVIGIKKNINVKAEIEGINGKCVLSHLSIEN